MFLTFSVLRKRCPVFLLYIYLVFYKVSTTASRTVLEHTQPPIQWVPGFLSLALKRTGCEDDHSPPSSAEVKNVWIYTSTLPIRLYGVVLS